MVSRGVRLRVHYFLMHISLNMNHVASVTFTIGLAVLGILLQRLAEWLRAQYMDNNRSDVESHIISPSDLHVTLDDIGGLAGAKKEIRLFVLLPLRHYDVFSRAITSDLHPPNGILLHGPPGTGKTMLAKAIAKESGIPFLSLSAASLESKWYGETAARIREIFAYARKHAPCILFFDEIDGLGKRRSDLDSGASFTLKTELLQNMSGIHSNDHDGVIVIGCTNNISCLDPALQRRFPRKIYVGLPDEEERLNILKLVTRNSDTNHTDLQYVSQHSPTYSGSDIYALYKHAIRLSLQKALEKVHSGKLDVHRLASSRVRISRKEWRAALLQAS
jgi:SpoVK/Ycf46/Vps4 family AAA+-type ATPase